jgi:hypothetical protein
MELKTFGVSLLALSLISHAQPHIAHTLFAGPPLMAGWSAEVMSVTTTAALMTGTR